MLLARALLPVVDPALLDCERWQAFLIVLGRADHQDVFRAGGVALALHLDHLLLNALLLQKVLKLAYLGVRRWPIEGEQLLDLALLPLAKLVPLTSGHVQLSAALREILLPTEQVIVKKERVLDDVRCRINLDVASLVAHVDQLALVRPGLLLREHALGCVLLLLLLVEWVVFGLIAARIHMQQVTALIADVLLVVVDVAEEVHVVLMLAPLLLDLLVAIEGH